MSGKYHASSVPRLPGNQPFVVIREARVTARPKVSWRASDLVKESYRSGNRGMRQPKPKGTGTWVNPKTIGPSARDLAYIQRQKERQSAGNIGDGGA